MYSCDNKYFVSTNWLEERLSDPNLRIIDASWYLPNVKRYGLKEFENNHIPGANFFDLDKFSDIKSELPHMALNEKDFSPLHGKLLSFNYGRGAYQSFW